jgi:aspartyl-tRNA(Asn)/glutamyl-tRNA(Gln) amidotransferase subunit C
MRISAEEVRATARLARLSLDDDEVEAMRRDLDAILDYMARLGEVDVAAIEPLTSVLDPPPGDILRPDEVGPHLSTEEALRPATRRSGEFFDVPRIITHDKDAG